MHTLVLGLGNPILTDDAVGVRVAEAVRSALEPLREPLAEVATAGVGGLALMELMIGYERAILIDALRGAANSAGVVRRLTPEDVRAMSTTERSVSPHDTSLTVALDLGRQMGLPLPDEIVIYAIGVTNILDFSEEPTPAVAGAIPLVTAAVLAELRAPRNTL